MTQFCRNTIHDKCSTDEFAHSLRAAQANYLVSAMYWEKAFERLAKALTGAHDFAAFAYECTPESTASKELNDATVSEFDI